MNADNSLNCALPDVQSSADGRHIPIQRVGVKSVRVPVVVASVDGPLHTVATVNMYVSLPAGQKGTHMSRFFRLLDETREPLCKPVLEDLMARMLKTLDAVSGQIEFDFPFFVRKSAPISKQSSLMSYEAGFTVTCENGETTVRERVLTPVTSLCPCSKEISRYGAHNQRSHITIDALCSEALPFEDLIRYSEKNGSCELWSLLKREDEKFVTEYAYDHAKFVEDIIRDVATDLNKDAVRAPGGKLRIHPQSFRLCADHPRPAHLRSLTPRLALAVIRHAPGGRPDPAKNPARFTRPLRTLRK